MGQAMIQIGDAPAGLKNEPGYAGQLGKVDLIDCIGRLMVVHMDAIEVKNDGDAM